MRRRLGPDWYLLVLRAFLAFVFLYAGISKVADRRFLDGDDPTSMRATVNAVRPISPIGDLLGPVADHATVFGVLMAIAELAVGLGVLLGLFTRVAAAGGMLLSLSLWLTVSWGAEPWYTSADLVYLFAFTPLLLHGAGELPALDGWLARARQSHPGAAEDRTRRLLLGGAVGIVGAVLLGLGAAFRGGRPKRTVVEPDTPVTGGSTTAAPSGSTSAVPSTAAPSTATSGGSSSSSAPSGPVLVKTAEVPVGGAASASADGESIWVLQLEAGSFTAYDARCPHQGCAVQFVSAGEGFTCPCHQSTFDARGNVTRGPATSGLTPVEVVSDGENVHEAR